MSTDLPEDIRPYELRAAVGATRFGYGAREGEIASLYKDAVRLTADQVRAVDPLPEALKLLPDSRELLTDMLQARRQGRSAFRGYRQEARLRAQNEVHAHLQAAVTSNTPFFERLVAFWVNHFTVSMNKPAVMPLVLAFEREAIRPNILGSYFGLLSAVVRHPAMLIYLDNVRSVGPNSPTGRSRGRGLNPMLARRILDTYTYGLDGGHTEKDVETLSALLTGWTVGLLGEANQGEFTFREEWHEEGKKRFLDRIIPEAGMLEGEVGLDMVARAPATGRHLARRMAQYFIADTPPPSIENEIFSGYMNGGSALGMVEGLLNAPGVWSPDQGKVKTPRDLAISTARFLGFPRNGRDVGDAMRQMGEAPYQAPTELGWPLESIGWITGEGMMDRLTWCQMAAEMAVHAAEKAGRASTLDPVGLALEAVGGLLRPETYRRMRVAFSPAEALAIFLASPEFQKR